ncbi:MAG: GDP-L-fucose synthase [Candidatus Omnitrophica bacterium]|nr:GDP-L-fucose synthase [Candidatus Omnitrophota bacterium]MBU2063992.1 GDP-L-fucose synthase [Candidatus Omnitrophota bacterium]
MKVGNLTSKSKIYIAGHEGLVGAALVRCFQRNGFSNLLLRTRSELDLMSRELVWRFFETTKPEYVIIAAAKVGGIFANMAAPVDFLVENLEIQNNILLTCQYFQVTKTVFLGSSCIYPRESPQPMREDYFMSGPLEPTNESYAVAKIAGIRLAQALRQQFSMDVICPMPANVYGPGDHFEFERSHVVSALVRRFIEAKRNNTPGVTLWGTGNARRELLHVDDLADACLFLIKHYDSHEIINVGFGQDLTIRELAETIATITGYAGKLEWDLTKPDGMPIKLLDVSRLHALGWRHKIDLIAGIQSVVADFEVRYPK